MSWYYYPKTSPLSVKDGIKAKSKRGAIGEKWWSQQFLEALHIQGMDNRLARGRTYARKGQVMKVTIIDGIVEAMVQGSMAKPYKITIRLTRWDDREWKKVIKGISEQALYSAQMLAGEMPHEIETIVKKADLWLFPRNHNDLVATCSCPDYANPCKHIAAVYYILAEQFDDEPFLIFAMRGKNKDDLLDALREERGSYKCVQEPDMETSLTIKTVSPLSVEGFYDLRASLDDFSVKLTIEPEMKGGLLRSLGPSPFFVGKKNLSDLLADAYEAGPLYVHRLVHGDAKDPVNKRKHQKKKE